MGIIMAVNIIMCHETNNVAAEWSSVFFKFWMNFQMGY